MRPEDCPKLNTCSKIEMILDKDLLDFQYAEAIRGVCAKCEGVIKVCCAGKFDPLHDGHRSHIQEAAKLSDYLIVITHPDEVVTKTSAKGFCYQPLVQRVIALQKELPCIDEIVVAEDEGGTVARVLKRLKPNIFAKGGDRTPDNMPQCELDACREIGCQVIYGVGGDKVESSSELVGRVII